ncbi:testis-expressed protein 264 [Alosa sapidissima]|uniref:testis-expressed protein 264 n=1 Tax=Alosa sapidissima TaxID=34773 RepID=UPI001C0867FF|nr:testis-expressed protein 264 [Alosa sapidissima]
MSDFLILSLILFLVLCLIVTIVLFVLYSGLLSAIDIRTGSPPIKKITIAYKFKEGPYKDCGASFTEACSIGPKLSNIAVFYDDPKQVPEDKCRYAVGSILSEGDDKPDEDLLKEYGRFGFSVMSFPEVDHAVTTTFPNKSPISPLIAAYRVYPELSHYIYERKLSAFPFMEICKDDIIHYVCPLARQNSFFVPEMCLMEKEEESDEDGTGGDSNSESSYASRAVPTESRESSLAPSTILHEEEQQQEEELSERAEHSEAERASNGSLGSGSSFEELDLEEEEGEVGEEQKKEEEEKKEEEPREEAQAAEERSPNKAAAAEKKPAADGEE